MSLAPSARDWAEHFDADGALVFASDGRELVLADAWPPNAATAARLRVPIGFGVTGLVARNAQPVLLDSDSPRNPVHRALLGLSDGETVARLCVPAMGLRDTVAGVVALHRADGHSPEGTRPREFTEADLARAVEKAGLTGLVLHAEWLWRDVHRHRTERDALIERAISAQEAERRRIAFDLHDGVTTALASMAFHLSAVESSVMALESSPDSLRAREQLGVARSLADLAYQQTRSAISGLHSLVLDDLGLVAALESLAQAVATDDGPVIDVVYDAESTFEGVPDHAAAALYRIAQEALGNAIKHAQAQRVVLSLRRVGESVVLGCTDDGIGFDPEERRSARVDEDDVQHLGLSSIAERCALVEASLRIESIPGRGTTMLIELPL